MRHRIVIDEIPPSLNRFNGRQASWQYRNEKRRWREAIAWTANGMAKVEKSVVEITYHFPDKRRRDPDNYCGKFILDGLVDAGVLPDDDFDHIDLLIKKGAESKRPYTEITIIEKEGDK